MLHFDSSHSIVTHGSRAPAHHTLPAFLNLNGMKRQARTNVTHLEFF